MATVPCPSCGLPRAEDLFGVIDCPLCGHAGRFAPVLPEPPAATATPAPVPSPRRPHRKGSWFVAGSILGFVAGAVAGVVGAIYWPTVRDRIGIDSLVVAAADTPTPDTPVSLAPQPAPPASPNPSLNTPLPTAAPAPPALAPAPLVGAPAPTLVAPAPPGTVPLPVAPAVPAAPVVVGPPPQVVPPNPFRPAAPAATRLDNPEGESRPIVRPGSTLVLRGRVKVLRISGLEAGAFLDCSELEASEVEVVGKIDGGSRLSVRATGGRVTFRAKVDGKSRVDIHAPGGTVGFEGSTNPTREGAKIEGGSTVSVLARAIRFHDQIGGIKTRVAVTLTAGGSLSFAAIDGPSRLEFTKADPDDPEPVVSRGKVGAPAVVARVEEIE